MLLPGAYADYNADADVSAAVNTITDADADAESASAFVSALPMLIPLLLCEQLAGCSLPKTQLRPLDWRQTTAESVG